MGRRKRLKRPLSVIFSSLIFINNIISNAIKFLMRSFFSFAFSPLVLVLARSMVRQFYIMTCIKVLRFHIFLYLLNFLCMQQRWRISFPSSRCLSVWYHKRNVESITSNDFHLAYTKDEWDEIILSALVGRVGKRMKRKEFYSLFKRWVLFVHVAV